MSASSSSYRKRPYQVRTSFSLYLLKGLKPQYKHIRGQALTYDFFCGGGGRRWPHEKNRHRAWRPQRPGAGDLKLGLGTLGFLSILLQKPGTGSTSSGPWHGHGCLGDGCALEDPSQTTRLEKIGILEPSTTLDKIHHSYSQCSPPHTPPNLPRALPLAVNSSSDFGRPWLAHSCPRLPAWRWGGETSAAFSRKMLKHSPNKR